MIISRFSQTPAASRAAFSFYLPSNKYLSTLPDSNPQTENLSQLKRGTGGRSSFSGVVATVFGATGFLGRYVVNQIGKTGGQLIIPHRCDSYDAKELRLTGDLGQVLFSELDPHDDETIRQAVRHSNVVINMIGRDNETKNFPFDFTHVDMAARIARISKESGVKNFIHFSALNASLTPQKFITSKGSGFLRSKAQGEIEVLREFGDKALIIRPADVWGQMDRFLFYYPRRLRTLRLGKRRLMPLYDKGLSTYKMPVSAYDMGKAIAMLANDPSLARGSNIIEAVGPNRYRLDHLVLWIYMHIRMSDEYFSIINHKHPLFWAKIYAWELLQRRKPHLCWERFERECHTDVLSESAINLEDLGLTELVKLEDRIKWEVMPLRKRNYYWDAIGEVPEPPTPPLFSKM